MPRGTQRRARSSRAQTRRERRAKYLGMQFSYTSKPSAFELAKIFEDLADELLDFSEVWPRLAPTLSKGLRRNLISQGSELGAKWKPLTPAYAERKGSGPLGYRTGAMLGQVSGAQLLSSSRRFADVGIISGPDDYAHDFHFGWARGGNKALYTPGRPFMALNPSMIAATKQEMGGHLDEVLQRAGRKLKGAK